MTVRISSEIENEVIARVLRDVQATLGPGYEDLVRDAAASVREIFNENARIEEEGEPLEPHWGLDYFVERVIEDVQDTIHSSFVDTSWPRCPQHQDHPLWGKDGSGAARRRGLK